MIICAALELQIEGLPYTTIVPCWRHGKGYEILRDRWRMKYELRRTVVQSWQKGKCHQNS